jgi:hypothetical protein
MCCSQVFTWLGKSGTGIISNSGHSTNRDIEVVIQVLIPQEGERQNSMMLLYVGWCRKTNKLYQYKSVNQILKPILLPNA